MDYAIEHKTRVIISVQALLFVFLIAFGFSGSSISLIRDWAPGLVSMDEKVLIGHPKAIRSDEWAVNTLITVGQYQNRDSRNPRINDSLGPAPRDMSVIHDVGVPTSELSSVAKANLWGFFAFDLRRALAWDWWVPVFIGLNGVWLLLNLLCPGQSGFNFSLALVMTLAPECVMWSNWPLLHIGTASLAVSFAILALKSRSMMTTLALALGTGLLASWFALQLYLPRLIPVALISVFTYAGYCIDRRVRFFTRFNCAFIIYTVLIASVILFDWFSRNYDGISRMLNSSYPGHRRIYGGTPSAIWDLNYVRGWLFPITSRGKFFANYHKPVTHPNISEAMSYIGLFIPILLSVICYALQNFRRVSWTVIFNAALLVLFVAYEYTGIPEILGDATFLNRSWQLRIILGTGLTSVILLSCLYRHRNDFAIMYRPVFLIACLTPFIVFFFRNHDLVSFFSHKFTSKLVLIVFAIVLIHVIFFYRIKYIAAALLLFVAPFTLFWNPVIIAPSHVDVNLPEALSHDTPAGLRHDGRFLVITGNYMVPNLFLASGHKVVNATSHYVDSYMYDNFYSKFDNPEQYNRFNHLNVYADSLKPDMRISGGPDWIDMRLNVRDFDFTVMPADYVIVCNSPYIKDLDTNSRLDFKGKSGDFYFYRIKNLRD